MQVEMVNTIPAVQRVDRVSNAALSRCFQGPLCCLQSASKRLRNGSGVTLECLSLAPTFAIDKSF
jgi:hypothetical protein